MVSITALLHYILATILVRHKANSITMLLQAPEEPNGYKATGPKKVKSLNTRARDDRGSPEQNKSLITHFSNGRFSFAI